MNPPLHETTEPFDIDVALERVEGAIAGHPKAAMFELRDRGYGSVFQQLVSCVLSIRTRDEESLPASLRLFERAATPSDILALSDEGLFPLIEGTSFPGEKARTIRDVARAALEHGGELPVEVSALVAIRGIGPKCAHLALGVAAGVPVIAVDVHVHRVTNRWGYVATRTPEETLKALETKLPERWAVEINARLVPFGKHVCRGVLPRCSVCPLNPMCPQVGVTKHA